MAPSASMLFLSYHQLHQPSAEAPPRKEAAAAAGRLRFGVSGAFSLGMFERRRDAAPAARAEGKAVRERDAGEEMKSPPSSSPNKELEEKFEEALRLSCWSS